MQAITGSRPRRALGAGLWALQALLAAAFAGGGWLKLSGDPAMVGLFADIGAGQWLRLFIGACEVAGAIGLLLPVLHRLAAAGLVGLMIGAAITNVVVLQISPAVPLVLLALAAVVVVTRGGRKATGR
jgi:uncharacterized membrane protein YphA (DoxX/SURF4 family)